jgi:hypothetical protein
MARDSKVVFEEMKDVMTDMTSDGEQWAAKGTKTASARMRKSTLALATLGKEFRSLSVAEAKA